MAALLKVERLRGCKCPLCIAQPAILLVHAWLLSLHACITQVPCCAGHSACMRAHAHACVLYACSEMAFYAGCCSVLRLATASMTSECARMGCVLGPQLHGVLS
eukprot:11664442-Alexandrium_andersonii.AAC.1